MHFKETDYGFEWGAAKIMRVTADQRKGSIVLAVSTPRASQDIHIYVTKGGTLRVFRVVGKEMIEPD